MDTRQTSKPARRSALARGRRLVLVDIENIAGGAGLTSEAVRSAKNALVGAGDLAGSDHVVVGTSHIGLLAVGANWKGARYVVRSGPDGADLALLDVFTERVAARYEAVLLASGDGIFAPAVAELGAAGVATTVIGRRCCMSRALRMAATRVIYLPDAPLTTDSGAAA